MSRNTAEGPNLEGVKPQESTFLDYTEPQYRVKLYHLLGGALHVLVPLAIAYRYLIYSCSNQGTRYLAVKQL